MAADRLGECGEAAAARRPTLRRSVVLVGLMGAGKTSVGTRLATALGAPFSDSDAEVEAAAGMSVAEIFRLHGEPAFRDVERKVIARLLSGEPKVLATGGGAFMDDETRALIARGACSVWLRADLDTLVSRTAGRTHRPLLNQGEPRAVLARLIEARYPTYAAATITVESRARQTHEMMVARILEALAREPGVLEGGDASTAGGGQDG
ncbi:MAG: shikimate kinase [Pseudomonadota bacterium]